MNRRVAATVAAALACQSFPAWAGGPEQLDQLEPGKGDWQAEYFGLVGPTGVDHAIEGMVGLTESLAIGAEIEGEVSHGDFSMEGFGPKLLYRLNGDGAPVGVGVQIQLGFNRDASLVEAEARLIAEVQDERWWAQADVMLRRESEGGTAATGLAYGWSLQRSVTEVAWIGIEGSGQSAPLWSDMATDIEHGHFFGPSLTFNWELVVNREIEIGLAYFRLVAGKGPDNSGRLFIQVTF